jgi:hypothetical protein
VRVEVRDRSVDLAEAASSAGVVTSRVCPIFQDHGYIGLCSGGRACDIAARGQHILDYVGSEELAANWFGAMRADAKIRREGITGKAAANQVHHDDGLEVRRTIEHPGNTMPEDLPTPAKSIQQMQHEEAVRERQRLEHECQPALFELPEPDADPDADSCQSTLKRRGRDDRDAGSWEWCRRGAPGGDAPDQSLMSLASSSHTGVWVTE